MWTLPTEKNVVSVKPKPGSYTEIELGVQVSYGYDDLSGKLNKLASVMMAQEAVLNFEIVEVDRDVAWVNCLACLALSTSNFNHGNLFCPGNVNIKV